MDDLNGLDWKILLKRLEDFATSSTARESLQEISPVKDANEAVTSAFRITQFSQLLSFGSRPFMESLDLFQSWFPRLKKKATLTRMELKDVRHFCRESLAFREYVMNNDLAGTLYPSGLGLNAEEPLSAIDSILSPDGDVRGDASEKIFQLTQEKQLQTRTLQQTMDRLVKSHDMESLLQEKYVTTREGRWVLPIKSGMRHGLEGIIHSTSQTKQTVFMEPQELVPMNNRLRQIEVEMDEEVERLLTELSHYLNNLCPAFEELKDILLDADISLAKAQLTVLLNANVFQFTESSIDLIDLRHPILCLNKENVIPNTVHLDESERLLLLSGPNAGGKTVLLKSIGLAAQMARCGLPIPAAKGSKLPFFKKILAAVGDQQSVDANLSTFAAHLKALNRATEFKSSDSLILIDEICGSTDPEEGAALARSFIESYLNNGVFAIVTSHLGALKSGWEHPGLIHGSLEFDKEHGPTYTLLKGMAGQSLAIYTAKLAGVSKKIVDRATELLSPQLRRYQTALEDVEELKSNLHRIQNETMLEKRKLEAERKNYEAESTRFNKEKDKLLEKYLKQAQNQVDQLLQEAQVKGLFEKHIEAEKVKFDLPDVVKASVQALNREGGSEAPVKIENAKQFYERYPAGSKVFITSVGHDGLIQGEPNAKGEIPVLCRSMRLTVPWQQLRPPEKPDNPTHQLLRKQGHFAASPADEDRSLDIRGLTVENAISKMELSLDQATLAGEDRIRIVHGHGTDTLKRAIRSYLSRSLYVKKWTAGSKESGGDGVTWVELQE